jgi:hypothetical protein
VNLEEAKKYFEKAAYRGHTESQKYLGDVYFQDQKNNKLAVKWYLKAALKGNVAAQIQLGDILSDGRCGVSLNYEHAKVWYLRAGANQGNTLAKQSYDEVVERQRIEMEERINQESQQSPKRRKRGYFDDKEHDEDEDDEDKVAPLFPTLLLTNSLKGETLNNTEEDTPRIKKARNCITEEEQKKLDILFQSRTQMEYEHTSDVEN